MDPDHFHALFRDPHGSPISGTHTSMFLHTLQATTPKTTCETWGSSSSPDTSLMDPAAMSAQCQSDVKARHMLRQRLAYSCDSSNPTLCARAKDPISTPPYATPHQYSHTNPPSTHLNSLHHDNVYRTRSRLCHRNRLRTSRHAISRRSRQRRPLDRPHRTLQPRWHLCERRMHSHENYDRERPSRSPGRARK